MDMVLGMFILFMGILLWFGCYACRGKKEQVAEEKTDNFRRM